MATPAPELIADLIPVSVNQADLMAALQPLYELLRVTPNHIFDIPGLQIGFGRVTFTVCSPVSEDEWAKDRPRPRVAEVDLQGQMTSELAQVITVEITQRDPLSGEEVAL